MDNEYLSATKLFYELDRRKDDDFWEEQERGDLREFLKVTIP